VSSRLLGTAFPLNATVTDVNGNLATPDGLTFTITPDGQSPVTLTWPTDPELVLVSTGLFQVIVDATLAPTLGHYRWEFLATGVDDSVLPGTSGAFDMVSALAYPWPFGYCDVVDVQARITGGTWDAQAADSAVVLAQVCAFIEEATAEIDMALAKRGYTVPLVPQVGVAQIAPTVWVHLRGICAMLSAGRVELARHGSSEAQVDNIGKDLIAIARAQLARIESGADNLTIFGVAGPSEPQVDPGTGMSEGTLTDMNGNPLPPLFTISGPVPDIGFPQGTGLEAGGPGW